MERTSDGRILLSPEDEEGVNALILAETKGVVSIRATTDERISAFVRRWKRLMPHKVSVADRLGTSPDRVHTDPALPPHWREA